MPIHNPNGPSVSDDGTYILLQWESTKLCRVRKSDGQFQVAASYDTDTTL